MKYNHLFNSHFSGCLHIAGYHDPHRKRDARIFMIPGDHTVVGVSDDVDAWIAPANIIVGRHEVPGGIDLIAILQSVRDGTFKGPNTPKIQRRILRLESDSQPAPQAAEAQAETKTTRRRLANV